MRRSRQISDANDSQHGLLRSPAVSASHSSAAAVHQKHPACCSEPSAGCQQRKRGAALEPADNVAGRASLASRASVNKRQKLSEHKRDEVGGQPAQATFRYQHRMLQAGLKGIPSDETVWVQCDVCTKWRPMPIGQTVRLL